MRDSVVEHYRLQCEKKDKLIAELEAELDQCLDCCKRVGELEAENKRLAVRLKKEDE